MPNTVDLSIYFGDLQTLIPTNNVEVRVYKSADYPTEAAPAQNFAPPHTPRTVMFPGLEKTNYKWKLLEMNGVTIVAERASFDVVPDDNKQIIFKAPVEIEAGVTVGLTPTTNSFVFDGTSGTEDWRGFEIYVERVGQGTMQKGVQYSWNSVTGTFTLLQSGDVFQMNELFNVEFGLIESSTASGVPPQSTFSGLKIVTGTETLVTGDIGKMILIKGASPFFEITLPDITLVTAGIVTYVEGGIGSHKCVRIKTSTGTIDFGKGARTDMKIGVCESFAFYRETGSTRWRVFNAQGNFVKVGRIILSDSDAADEFNTLELDGSEVSATEYARLYEDFVLNLTPAQVCNYADHATGTNKYKFSFSNGTNFFLPDRRDLWIRSAGAASSPGQFLDQQLLDHQHEGTSYNGANGAGGLFGRGLITRLEGQFYGTISQKGDLSSKPVDSGANLLTVGSELRVKSHITRQFVLV